MSKGKSGWEGALARTISAVVIVSVLFAPAHVRGAQQKTDQRLFGERQPTFVRIVPSAFRAVEVASVAQPSQVYIPDSASPAPSAPADPVRAEESVVAAEAQASVPNSSQNASAPTGSITVGPSRMEELSYRIGFCTRDSDFSAILSEITHHGTGKYDYIKDCWQ